MGKALNLALADALRGDDRVVMFGEDVGKLGGVFRVSDGLQESSAGACLQYTAGRGDDCRYWRLVWR